MHFGKIRFQSGFSFHRRSVYNRKVSLLVIRAKLNKKIKSLIKHPIRPCFRQIDFVYDNDNFESGIKSFFKHEFSLRHRAVFSVNQKQSSVDHAHDALHLAAKISVSWSVHDIDFKIFIFYRRVFGKNSNAALSLKIV